MAVTINSYADVQSVLTAFYQSAGVSPGSAPHHVFWAALSYQDFVTGNVPGVGPEFGGPYKILVKNHSAQSNIINALEGTAGGPFDPNTGQVGQMPQPNPPYNSATPSQSDVIAALKAWIDKGCPEHAAAAAHKPSKPAPKPPRRPPHRA